MTAARRLAAILAADVVGYSRLMGEDEAGTAKIVRERREAATPIVRSFGGRLVKTMGDGSNSRPSSRQSNARSRSRR
jgi:class 3 adenylate cyclase